MPMEPWLWAFGLRGKRGVEILIPPVFKTLEMEPDAQNDDQDRNNIVWCFYGLNHLNLLCGYLLPTWNCNALAFGYSHWHMAMLSTTSALGSPGLDTYHFTFYYLCSGKYPTCIRILKYDEFILMDLSIVVRRVVQELAPSSVPPPCDLVFGT